MDTFVTEVDVEDSDDKSSAKKIKITWRCEIEARAWGIKSILVTVPEQTIEGCFSKYNKDTGEDEYRDRKILIQDCAVDFEMSPFGVLRPDTLEIFKGKARLVF